MRGIRATYGNRLRFDYGAVRVVLGLILLAAAGLKAHQLATGPTAEAGLLTSRWFLVAAVESEIVLGLCLLSGVLARTVWLVALGCFAVFACVSFSKGLAGEASCGCFGTVKVNPWYTFALDAAAVAALLRWRPSFSQGSEPSGERPAAVRLAAFASVWLAVGLPIGWLAGRFEPTIVTDEGEILGESQIVVLEPERWLGMRFPLLPHIDIGSRLAEGRWIVLLYHHDCPECRRVFPEYERVARLTRDAGRPQVALVEVPPFRSERDWRAIAGVQRGRLSDAKDWFVQTPTEILLDRGIVTAIRGAESFTRDRRESRPRQEVKRLDRRMVRAPSVVIR